MISRELVDKIISRYNDTHTKTIAKHHDGYPNENVIKVRKKGEPSKVFLRKLHYGIYYDMIESGLTDDDYIAYELRYLDLLDYILS